jgi:hypothetical protein
MTRYSVLNRNQIELMDVGRRGHDLLVENLLPLAAPSQPCADAALHGVIRAMMDARRNRRPVILMMGAHPVKLGLSRFLCDLLRRGVITHLAVNGAGVIHDFELALLGGTSENVSKWIADGQFGLWRETGQLNDVIRQAASRNEGLAEGVGRAIHERQFPHRAISLAATAWQCGIPMTCHVGVGSDIIHPHANCDGAALGKTSYLDFLIFAASVQQLEGGLYLNVGTSVTGPEVYLKALAMARNVARQEGKSISQFTTAVFDLVPMPPDFQSGVPDKSEPLYYYRPWKTILVRTVADGGTSYYVCGDHSRTIPTLWHEITTAMDGQSKACHPELPNREPHAA